MIFRARYSQHVGAEELQRPIARYGEHCVLRIIRHASWQRIIASGLPTYPLNGEHRGQSDVSDFNTHHPPYVYMDVYMDARSRSLLKDPSHCP